MAKHFDPRTLLKKIAVPLLQEFFHRRGELLKLPWDELKETGQIVPIYEGWQRLPDAPRRQVQTILQDLLELADSRGTKVLAEEVLAKAPQREWEFISCRSHLNKAMWFFLNFPEAFDRAALFSRADALSSGRWAVRRNRLPSTPIDVSPELRRKLESALRDYYWPNEMRGKHCHVEHYTRSGGHEYFFAYLDDWPDVRLVFEDDGKLGTKSQRYAFSVLFVFCPDDGSLEIVAKGGHDVHYTLQQASAIPCSTCPSNQPIRCAPFIDFSGCSIRTSPTRPILVTACPARGWPEFGWLPTHRPSPSSPSI